MNSFSQIGAHALAYLGDVVIELMVREALILKGYEKAGKLNNEARKFVTAVAQNYIFLTAFAKLLYRPRQRRKGAGTANTADFTAKQQ